MDKLKSRIRKRKKKSHKKKKSKKLIKRRITPERFLKALEDSFGIIKTIASNMGLSYETVRAYIKDAPEDIKELFENERERLADIAEETMAEMMQQRLHFPTALSSSKFVLTNAPQSKKKGYKDKKELTVQGGEKPLKVQNENVVSLDQFHNIPIEIRRQMLEEAKEMEEKEKR